MSTDKIEFTIQDTQNPLWVRLKPHLEARLAYLRSQNDSDLDPVETSKLRGRIAEVRAMLSLDKDYVVRMDGK